MRDKILHGPIFLDLSVKKVVRVVEMKEIMIEINQKQLNYSD